MLDMLSGLLKEVHQELNLGGENGNLVHITEKEEVKTEETALVLIARWNWMKQNYFIE
ncbi:hypothetical protein ACFVT8_17760 [Lysinibacillus sp. NPDC058147]|uniref:hypothetical protein n=1 Tax=unclassified Lysinibacillus TaxID=2636778 RepID=UPI0036D80C13